MLTASVALATAINAALDEVLEVPYVLALIDIQPSLRKKCRKYGLQGTDDGGKSRAAARLGGRPTTRSRTGGKRARVFRRVRICASTMR